jgi:DNA topoisomerase-1
MKTLVIVESPNKIKKISEILGDNYLVVASVGHVKDLASGGKHGIGINIEDNFRPHYILLKDKIEVVDKIINASCECNEILLCMDADREGSKIASDVADILKSTGKPMFRAEFNEITKTGIEKGIKEKHAINTNMVKAQEARRVLDRIVGFTVSSYLMTAYGNSLSAGRVQSVATRLISDKETEINAFKPEEYWTCNIKLQTQSREIFSSKYDGKIKNKEQSDKLVSFIQENNHFVVSKIVSKQVKDRAPAPLITASLQQVMAKRGWSPDKSMSVAQGLYESGSITYIRTDATTMAEEAIVDIRKWIKENNYDLPKTKNIYVTKETAQAAHECIRPTNINALPDSGYMNGDEKELYSVIWQYAIASQMTPAIWNTLNVKIVNKNDNKIVFKSSGKALADKGFLKIFGDVEMGKIEIPNLIEKQELLLDEKSIKAEQKHTQPPPRYNTPTLLKKLEDLQIGRPSTYASIFKKISDKNNYIILDKNVYKPTKLGTDIVNLLTKYFDFMKYDYTSKLELQLDEIAEGKIDILTVLKEFYSVFRSQLYDIYNGSNEVIHCEKCNWFLSKRKAKNGSEFYGCINYPKCYNTKSIDKGNSEKAA